MRGYLERCNQPKIKNFISWVSPQMGVYGVPNVRGVLPYITTHLSTGNAPPRDTATQL
jgi:hypothetical protein